MSNLLQKLLLGGSAVALISIGAASAQEAPAGGQPVETVTVTGTSIRGITPVGSNLMTLGPEDIKSTGASDIQGILGADPALMNFGTGVQGGGNGAYQPSIHSLGNSGANSTLVLVDGHRFATGGTNHSEPDPNLVPFNMVERVDVLAEGASSIYGSDAIAGVVNFITRKKFDGIQLDAQDTVYPDKNDLQFGFLAGTSWDRGSVLFAYNYVYQQMLLDTDRPWTSPAAVVARGGTNPGNFNCDPASIQPNGTGNIFTSAASGVQLANAPANSPCSQWLYGALVPENVRNGVTLKGTQEFGSSVTLNAEMNYATRDTHTPVSRGTVTDTVFGTGPQANPFYVVPAGFVGAATKETIRWDGNALLGPGAFTDTLDDNFYADVDVQYRPDDNWTIDVLALEARDVSQMNSKGVLDAGVANLALNGTINSNGSTTTPAANLNIIVNQLPLTAATALDVWNPAATNRTSAAVRQNLIAGAIANRQYTTPWLQLRAIADGKLFDLPAGPLKIAVGAELNRMGQVEFDVTGNGTGQSAFASDEQKYDLRRQIYSAFLEANIPVVSQTMNVPLMQKFDLDISGRYDHYSDAGVTENPKLSFEWQVYDDLRLRGNYATSFVGPPLDETGDPQGRSTLATYAAGTNNVNVPVQLYPAVTQMGIAGCTAASVTCNINSLQGLAALTIDPHMKPDKGRTWGLGFDFRPSFLPGATVNTTLWYASLKGAAQTAQIGFIATNSALSSLLVFYPGAAGAPQSAINALTQNIVGTTSAPPVVNYLLNRLTTNLGAVKQEGVDLHLGYVFDTNGWGTFSVDEGASIFLWTKNAFGLGGNAAPGAYYSITNTLGANNTFSSIALQDRGSITWNLDPYQASLIMNHTGSYHNWSSSAINAVALNAGGNPVGGGDVVHANITFDLHLGYDFNTEYMGHSNISVTARNLLNAKPPFINGGTGLSAGTFTANASVLERGVTLALETKL